MMKKPALHQHMERHRERIHHELFEFLQIPTISADSSFRAQVREGARWIARQTEQLGFQTTVDETAGHPVVLARRIDAPERPALLIYGHYDVQPPDPLDEWLSDPFSPEIRDGFLYARGVTDNKGQFFTALKAIEAFQAEHPSFPLNLILVAEGEEEIGSPHFEPWLVKNQSACASDALIILDGHQYKRGIPALYYGLRGLCYVQADLSGPPFDLHSGIYGGAVTNPANVLATLLSQLKNLDGRITVPHFYDRVLDPEPWERAELAALPFDEAGYRKTIGVNGLMPEKGYTLQESLTLRPTLDICGIWGGYTGEGTKTIIPARAGAKVSMRLVPSQDPAEIARLISDHLHSLLPPGAHLKVTDYWNAEPVVVPRESKIFRIMHQSIESHFGRAPVYLRMGATIGAATVFHQVFHNHNFLITGWGSPDDQPHSPNERLDLNDFERGIHTMIDCIGEFMAAE